MIALPNGQIGKFSHLILSEAAYLSCAIPALSVFQDLSSSVRVVTGTMVFELAQIAFRPLYNKKASGFVRYFKFYLGEHMCLLTVFVV